MFAETILGVAQLGIHPSPYRPRPSSAGPERCMRQLVYKGRGVPEPPPGRRLAMIFRDGHTHEDTSLEFLRQSLFQIHGEQRAINIPLAYPWREDKPDYRCPECSAAAGRPIFIKATTLHGHIDALATTIMGETYLFEHKAVVSHFFQRYWEEEKTPYDYFTQITMYLRGLHEEGLNVTAGALVIKNKDTGAMLEFEFQYEYDSDTFTITAILRAPGSERKTVHQTHQGLYHQAIEKFRQIDTYIANEQLPERLESDDDIRCQYCPYLDLCWDGYQMPALTERLIIPDALKSTAKAFIELDQQLGPLEKQHKELKDTLKAALVERQVLEAFVDDQILVLTKGSQKRLDDKRLPIMLKEHFSRTIDTLKLTIKSALPTTHAAKQPKKSKVSRSQHSDAA